MRKNFLLLLLAIVFILSQITIAEAKGSSRGSRSSSKSSSFSKSYSSSSKSSSGSSSSSSSSSSSKNNSSSIKKPTNSTNTSNGYSSSSVRKVPSSSNSATSSNSKTQTAKNSYMQDQYKKNVSTSNYKSYKQNLNSEQQKVYNSSLNKNYNLKNKLNFETASKTRPQRINYYNSRPVRFSVNSYYFGGPLSYGSGFVGPWDLWFLMRASDLFWYHHWNDIYASRNYFQAAQFANMEQRIRNLEQKNIARDANYLEPGVDPDLQFSKDYAEKNLNNIYYTNKYPNRTFNPFWTIVIIIFIVVALIIIFKLISKQRKKKPFNSRMY